LGRGLLYRTPFDTGLAPISASPTSVTLQSGDLYGSAVASSGDADLDGLSEFMVFASSRSNGTTSGAGFLFEATDSAAVELAAVTSTSASYISSMAALGTFSSLGDLSYGFSNSTAPAMTSGATGAVYIRPYLMAGGTYMPGRSDSVTVLAPGVRELGRALTGG
jgi:hypothetical protein